MDKKCLNVDDVVKAIEDDAGQRIPGLRKSLLEMEHGTVGRIHTQKQIFLRTIRKIAKSKIWSLS